MRARASACSGKRCSMPDAREPVEDAELLLAQPLVDDRCTASGAMPPAVTIGCRGLPRAQIRRRRAPRSVAASLRHARRTIGRARRPAPRPSALSGTSTSRSAMSITARPAAYAASRATLPALSPWRTIQRCSGQRFFMRGLTGSVSRPETRGADRHSSRTVPHARARMRRRRHPLSSAPSSVSVASRRASRGQRRRRRQPDGPAAGRR